ncbi:MULTISPECIES: hypothetical protein [unclassified Streptomyces]|uniref:hypothetical protein n=1 Tax=unclassified Streptomyces TaxID=2593676 RepID=UPI0022535BD1|nr:hypothetical protein [Streptomyces sp. NBC_01551]MCX4524433.1 hypothetical protein [Streptomyces sp. NBC_01551]
MESQRGRTGRRRFLLILGGPLLLAGTGIGIASALSSAGEERPGERNPGERDSGERDSGEPDPHRVRTDLAPLKRRFGAAGELLEAHWQGYDLDGSAGGDRYLPSPDSRLRLVGVARLGAGQVAGILRDAGYSFAAAAPKDLPERLKPYAPADAAWQRAEAFDALVNRPVPGLFTSSSGGFLLDAERDLVCFDVVELYT